MSGKTYTIKPVPFFIFCALPWTHGVFCILTDILRMVQRG